MSDAHMQFVAKRGGTELLHHQDWENVCFDHHAEGDFLERIKIPGGWLYRTIWFIPNRREHPAVAMVFVPDAPPPTE